MDKEQIIRLVKDSMEDILRTIKEYDPDVQYINLSWTTEDDFFNFFTLTGDKDKKLDYLKNNFTKED